MKMKSILIGFSALLGSVALTNAADVPVTADITTDTTWTADNAYILGQPIFVKNGAKLTIEAGTTIYGYEDTTGSTVTFGSLVITRGSQIFAEGTVDAPIVFTALAERDGVDDGQGGTREINLTDSGFWGGLIVLGKAVLNTPDNPIINPSNPVVGEFDIEGFPAGANSDITYGGSDDADNSGVIRYVSIRFGGYEFQTDEEINGLTLGAVGSGTTIEYVEVFNNQDDGVEMFGGTVDLRHMVMAFNEDESFDWDQGYRGRGQYWFAVQKNVGAGSNYGAEMDGGDGDDKSLMPYATPVIMNATYIGAGAGNPQDNYAFRFKDNTGGGYYNSIFTDFKDTIIRVDLDGGGLQEARFTQNDLALANNIFGYVYLGGTTPMLATTVGDLTKDLNTVELGLAAGGIVADPVLGGISRIADGGLDPRPAAGSPALSGTMTTVTDGWFETTSYKGAFSANDTWMDGWTKLSQDGYLPSPSRYYETAKFGWVYLTKSNANVAQWVFSYTLDTWVYSYGEFSGLTIIGIK